MRKLVLSHEETPVERMEVFPRIHAVALHRRLPVGHDDNPKVAIGLAEKRNGILVATSASGKAGRVSVGSVIRAFRDGQVSARCSSTVGSSDDQKSYTGDLDAIATALRSLPNGL